PRPLERRDHEPVPAGRRGRPACPTLPTMLKPFFQIAMQAPGRQRGFRRMVVTHVLFVSALAWAATAMRGPESITNVGYILLTLGIVEGAALVGWRLTQLPKSQAFEFMLSSPVQPRRVFVAEAAVGVGRFALVWLSGLPLLGLMVLTGAIDPRDLALLSLMPPVWGVAAGLMLTAWVYEPPAVRKAGELFSLLGVLVYLIVGVVAGEHLLMWMRQLPEWAGRRIFDGVMTFHNQNPFGVVRYWFAPDRADWLAWERLNTIQAVGMGLAAVAGLRAAFRLRGHFHDRHYKPISSSRPDQSAMIGDRPLSWWAVRRVMEYSGRVNLWLAGGFCLLYSAYLAAGDAWPTWMGRLVFQLFEQWGGAPTVAAAMVVMSTVPAVFQFGLWDATVPDRCKRLELLLLTDLIPDDYWHASLRASWRRGRGYLFAAGMLWLALGVSGRNSWLDVAACAVGGAVVWAFSFTFGFRSFATGKQTSGLASLLVLGVPMVFVGLLTNGHTTAATFLPTALGYLPLRDGIGGWWVLSVTLYAGLTVWLARRGLRRCDRDLRAWYDANQGNKSVE
ncbi:MAG: hypothetical protein ACRC7O_14245, partial [Fimbriiglobus sp.]